MWVRTEKKDGGKKKFCSDMNYGSAFDEKRGCEKNTNYGSDFDKNHGCKKYELGISFGWKIWL